MALAKLVAIYHGAPGSKVSTRMLERVKREAIDTLPPGSHIHLEMDWNHPDLDLPPRARELLADRNFFSELGRYAESLGHHVHWMETPERFMEMEHGHVQQLEKAIEAVGRAAEDESGHGQRQIQKAEDAANDAYDRLGTAPTATHRTEGMHEHLERHEGQPNAIAMAGAVHIKQLALRTGQRISRQIHPFPDAAAYQRALRNAVKQEKRHHEEFLKMQAEKRGG